MEFEFEWDEAKANTNRRKHGASFQEASSVFRDPMSRTIYDDDHSMDEDRYITIGVSDRARLILVSHCEREGRIRIISARPLNPQEREAFENERFE